MKLVDPEIWPRSLLISQASGVYLQTLVSKIVQYNAVKKHTAVATIKMTKFCAPWNFKILIRKTAMTLNNYFCLLFLSLMPTKIHIFGVKQTYIKF